MSQDDRQAQQPRDQVPWHAMPLEEVLRRLEAREEGLTDDEARRRRQEHGPNALAQQEGRSKVRLVLGQLTDPLIYVLLGAAVLSLVLRHWADAGVILGVVVLNTIIGAVQEWRAEAALAALHAMAAPKATVVRDGRSREVPAEEIVPGDVVVLDSGDRAPADARLIEASDLRADESALTGESRPVSKGRDEALPEETPLAERTNMVWMSTSVTGGRGRAVVVATGMDTAMGGIAGQVQQTQREDTPLQRRLARLGKIMGGTAMGLGVAIFLLGLLRGKAWYEMILFSIAAAVSAVPAGLPAVISVTLALGVRRMAREHAIVRRLPAVETLGSTTVICTDKTGTLTQNQMTVRRILCGGRVYTVTGEGFSPEGEIRGEDGEPIAPENLPDELRTLLLAGALTTDATIQHDEEGWHVDGEPTEAALEVAARKAGLGREQVAGEHPRRDQVPFSEERNYKASLNDDPEGRATLYVEGAPESVLEFCSHVIEGGERFELTDERRGRIRQAHQDFTTDALRTLAGACRHAAQDRQELDPAAVEHDLTFLGLWGMVDPPRPEAAESVARARGAGIRVVMITGDHAETAAAIAREAGVAGEDAEPVSGQEVDQLEGDALAERALRSGVFARATPEHKQKVLHALKDRGEIVAMTGDGVNDAPALKGADIGVAMGQAGTEVAREAADLVLTDDNFATIVRAIEEGRVIFSNLRRVVFFLITTSAAEVLTFATALLLGWDLPMTAVMVLWINLVSDGSSDVPLGVEPRHRDVLSRRPRPPGQGLLDWHMVRRVAMLAPFAAAGTLVLFWYYQRSHGLAYARTAAFTTLAAFQWFQAANARSSHLSILRIGPFSNRWLLVGVGIAIVLQLAVVYTWPGQAVFGTEPLEPMTWLLMVPAAATILVADEIFKRLGAYGKPPIPERASDEPAPRPQAKGSDGRRATAASAAEPTGPG